VKLMINRFVQYNLRLRDRRQRRKPLRHPNMC